MDTNIKVNGKALEGFTNVTAAEDSSMLITMTREGRTLDAIVGIFAGGAKIELLSGETVTATYYNKTVDSVKLNGDIVTVHIAVNELSDDTAEEINGRVDTSDGAIEELAGMTADHEARIAALEEQIAALIPASETGEGEDAVESAAETNEDAAESAAETDENAAKTQQGISSETGAESTENENVSSGISGTEASNG